MKGYGERGQNRGNQNGKQGIGRMYETARQQREEVLRWSLTRRWTVFLLLWSSLTLLGNLLTASLLGLRFAV
jgi:membrane protein YqaA with SNARE-associated domain